MLQTRSNAFKRINSHSSRIQATFKHIEKAQFKAFKKLCEGKAYKKLLGKQFKMISKFLKTREEQELEAPQTSFQNDELSYLILDELSKLFFEYFLSPSLKLQKQKSSKLFS